MHLLEWKTLTLEGYHPEFKLSHIGFVTMGRLVSLFDHFFVCLFVFSWEYWYPHYKVIV